MLILGIETSCDETAVAVIEGSSAGSGQGDKIKVLSNIVSSQVNIHKKYGGVVPEVAAREHVLQILPVINEALEQAGIPHPNPPPLTSSRERVAGIKSSNSMKTFPPSRDVKSGREVRREGLSAIAVATGPGLITSLLVGVETAKVLSYVWNVPVVSINHIEGHIYANFVGLSSNVKAQMSKLFPAIILTVSGGHTMLVLMEGHGKFKTIGETRDDAAGEAFDKAAKLLHLGYPGGPAVAFEAEKFIKQSSKISNSKFLISNKIPNPKPQTLNRIKLPRPMINSKSYDFSFSGLKTALLYELKKDSQWKKKVSEYAKEFQQAIIDVLISKTIRAAKEYKARTVMLTGGVAANKELRKQLEEAVKSKLTSVQFIMPDIKYTTDNAVMMAVAGYYKAKRKEFTHPLRLAEGEASWQKLKVDCNLEL